MNLLSDQVLWHIFGSGPLAGNYTDKQAVMELFGKYMDLIDSQSTEIHDILANDQHTATLGTLKISRQGPSLEQKITDVIHPRAGSRSLAVRRGPGQG